MSSQGKELFIREWKLVVAPTGSTGTLGAIEQTLGLDVSKLRIVFKVKKNLKREPNTCNVQIYNLSSTSRDFLSSASKLVLRLDAGYKSTGTSQLFLGEVRSAWSTKEDGVTWVTTVTTGDSEKEMQEARIHISLGPSVPPEVALTAICRSLKVGEGNVAQAVAMLKSRGVAAMFGPGTAISGKTALELSDFCRSAGLSWSVQDGKLQIIDKNKPLSDLAVELGSDSGLVGSPSIDFAASSKTKKGGVYVKARALLIPELTPGRKIVLKSEAVSGAYRIEEVEYEGDTHGLNWYANLTCRSY